MSGYDHKDVSGAGLRLGLRVGFSLVNKSIAGVDPTITFTWNPENNQTLPGGTTFTRASIKQEFDGTDYTELSSGTIPENSAAVGGGAQGFHPEPEATNQFATVDLTLGNWSKTNVGITDNGINALGLNEYEMEALEITDVNHRVQANANSGAAGCGYTICEQGSGRFITMRRSGAGSWGAFDLQTGTVTEQGGTGTLETDIVDLDGPQKCIVRTGETSAVTLISISDTGTPGSSTPSFIASGETILHSHVQYENTNYETSPIVTSGSPVTREADVLDTGIVIATAFSALLDITLPLAIGTGNTISLLGPDATATDILFVDENFDVRMNDGGTLTTIGASSAGSRLKVSYGRDAAGRSASLNGATAVTGDAPSAAHEGDTFQLGSTNSVNQSRCIHHLSTLFDVKKTDAELEGLSS